VVHQRHPRTADQPYLRPTGTYLIERSVLDAVPATSFQDIKENLIPKLYAAGSRIDVFVVDDVSPRVLNAETYLDLNWWMIQRLLPASPTHSVDGMRPQLLADRTAQIDEGAVIIGPVILGPDVHVCSQATIVGPVSVGAGSTIGAGAVLTRSVIWENCSIGKQAIVDRCLLADGAEVGAGTMASEMLRSRTATRRDWRRAPFVAKPTVAGATSVLARPALF
jgi:NDP-sugar pyrophosphorylase family protein